MRRFCTLSCAAASLRSRVQSGAVCSNVVKRFVRVMSVFSIFPSAAAAMPSPPSPMSSCEYFQPARAKGGRERGETKGA
jgi:hypothetical protein